MALGRASVVDGSAALRDEQQILAPSRDNAFDHWLVISLLLSLGADGLQEMSETAVLNANYLLHRIKDRYDVPYPERPMHECVVSDKHQLEHGVKALDIAKRLIDYGYHPPTIYFPLIVEEAIMIEPTETESKRTLDEFIESMRAIDREAAEQPDLVREAPHTTPVKRLDEVRAARQPDLRWKPS